MGVDLMGRGSCNFNWSGWRWCLRVAREFGWTPVGTLAPRDFKGEWCGTYYSNDEQEVSEADAFALAAALEEAVDYIRNRQPLTAGQISALDDGNSELLLQLAKYASGGRFWLI